MPIYMGSFVLSNSKRILNNFDRAIDGFESYDVYYKDTDSLYTEKKTVGLMRWSWIDWKKLVTSQNQNKDGSIFCLN